MQVLVGIRDRGLADFVATALVPHSHNSYTSRPWMLPATLSTTPPQRRRERRRTCAGHVRSSSILDRLEQLLYAWALLHVE